MSPRHLYVWLQLPDGRHVRAGELAFTEPVAGGRYQAAFRYADSYLNFPDAFALDPANLPLSESEFGADMLGPPLGAFADALPDAWGRRLVALRGQRDGRQYHEPDMLLMREGGGLGALEFYPPDKEPMLQPAARIRDLEALASAADRFDRGEEVPADLAMLFQDGSTPGGARPKALVEDTAGRQWIAKFGLSRDDCDMVGLEYAAMETARAAGLDVPVVRVVSLGESHKALLVERFDVHPEGGRRHGLSFSALLKESRFYSVTSYRQVFDALRRYTERDPIEDLSRLFRQAAFNAVICNRDDHLKNLMLLRDEQGYGLSPAFDLLPNVGRRVEHVLAYGETTYPPSRQTLLGLAERLGLPAIEILDEVIEAAGHFPMFSREAGVPAAEVERFSNEIDLRRAR
jgi:serine/threonine-protein kinase HipA